MTMNLRSPNSICLTVSNTKSCHHGWKKHSSNYCNKSSGVKQSDATSGLIIQSWPPMINIHLSRDQNPCDIPLYWLLNKDNDIHRQLHSMHEYAMLAPGAIRSQLNAACLQLQRLAHVIFASLGFGSRFSLLFRRKRGDEGGTEHTPNCSSAWLCKYPS